MSSLVGEVVGVEDGISDTVEVWVSVKGVSSLVGEVVGVEDGVSDAVEVWVSVTGDEDESPDPPSLPHPTVHKEAPRNRTLVLYRVVLIISIFLLPTGLYRILMVRLYKVLCTLSN